MRREPRDEVHQDAANHLNQVDEGTVRALLRVGDLFLASDSFALALTEYEKVLDRPEWEHLSHGERCEAHLRIGRARSGLGDLEGALAAGTRAAAEMETIAAASPREAGLAHAFLAQVHRKRGEHPLARERGLAALRHLSRTDEHSEVASLQLNLGAIFLREGDLRQAERFFQDGLASFRRIEDRAGIAKALNSLGVVYNNLCQWQSAIDCLSRAAEIDEALGNYSQIALRCLNLGVVHTHTGDWGSARSLLERSLEMSRKIGDGIGVARASIGLARIERWSHSFFRAEMLVRDALAAAKSGGARREHATALEEAGAIAAARGDLNGAMARFNDALAVSAEISSVTDHTADVTRRIAEVALSRDELDVAFDKSRAAYGAAVRVEDRRIAGNALRILGSVFRRRGESARARSSFTRAIGLLERIGARLELAKVLRDAGQAGPEAWCSTADARSYLVRAEALFRAVGLPHEVARTLFERARLETVGQNGHEAMGLLREAESSARQAGDEPLLREVEALRRRVEFDTAHETAAIDAEFQVLRRAISAREADITLLLDRVVRTARGDRGFVVLDNGGRVAVRACEGMPASIAREVYRALCERHGDRLAQGEAVVSYGEPGSGPQGVLSYVVVPVSVAGVGVGALYVDRLPDADRVPFGRLELHFLGAIGAHVTALLAAEGTPSEMHPTRTESPFSGVVTRSRRMLDILDILKRVASASSTILLQGETGTGKGLIAYEVSRWSDGPFVTINCADLSETVLESELFGHARNAFTGAGAEKRGLFEVANGGTVFIDEIDKTSRNFQERLLRVVDRREIKPVGSTVMKKVDCRIIVAANRDLRSQVERGEFLKDLYYRLRVISIDLPPLRDRREDIPILVEHFLERFQSKMRKPGINFAPPAMESLVNHDWPGNIRDLENEVERAVALAAPGERVEVGGLSDEVVKKPLLPAPSAASSRRKPLSLAVEEMEMRMIVDALARHNGNKSRAAADLGLTRRGLKNKITRYGLE